MTEMISAPLKHRPAAERAEDVDSTLAARTALRAVCESGGSPAATVRTLPLKEALFGPQSAELQRRWLRLERESASPNAFLSPRFVIPAAAYLLGTAETARVVLVEACGPSEVAPTGFAESLEAGPADVPLLGLALIDADVRSRRLPLRHWESWRSIHSFLGDPLLHRDAAGIAATALWQHVQESGTAGWDWVEHSLDTPSWAALSDSAEAAGCCLLPYSRYERAAVRIADTPADWDAYLAERLSARWRKSVKRARRKLEAHGVLEVASVRPTPSDLRAAEDFMELEAKSWKGEEGTALQCRDEEREFFTDMIRRFSESGDAVFVELRVGGRLVGSTCNLLSGGFAFSFKIAFDPELGDCSPGTLTNVFTAVAASGWSDSLTLLDSCAKPGSSVEHLWPDRRSIGQTLFVRPGLATRIALPLERLRGLKRSLRERNRRNSATGNGE